uniref:Large ribosomal subunit protein bL17m n=1 Tax=Meloidogyne javanica TaxID=6303 RepID=A0A915MYH8_MELJA
MSAHRLLPSLPRIKVPIGHIPQRLKLPGFKNPRGHLELLRMLVNRVFKDERVEFRYNRAEECRQYVERLIQLGIHRGLNDEYTKEMFDWWFPEKDLIDKMFNVFVPRFEDYPIDEPYTSIFRLPSIRAEIRNGKKVLYMRYSIAVLELKGNPYPSMETLEENRRKNLTEFVKNELLKTDVSMKYIPENPYVRPHP